MTDEGEWDGPGDDDVARWVARQRRLVDLDVAVRNVEVDDELVPTSRLLAELLWELHDDKPLWKLLEKGQLDLGRLDEETRVRALAAAEIDWEPILIEVGYEPPPPMDVIADEFRVDLRRAILAPGQADANDLRRRLGRLARALDEALADERPTGPRRLWALVRSYAPVVRRAAVVNGGAAVATAGSGALATAVGGPVLGGVVGAAVGGATRAGLDRALPKVAPEARVASAKELRILIHDRLRPEDLGRACSAFELLADVVDVSGGDNLLQAVEANGYERIHEELVTWVDQALAGVFLAWELAAEQGSPELEVRLGGASEILIWLRRALADLAPDLSLMRALMASVTEALQGLLAIAGPLKAR